MWAKMGNPGWSWEEVLCLLYLTSIMFVYNKYNTQVVYSYADIKLGILANCLKIFFLMIMDDSFKPTIDRMIYLLLIFNFE